MVSKCQISLNKKDGSYAVIELDSVEMLSLVKQVINNDTDIKAEDKKSILDCLTEARKLVGKCYKKNQDEVRKRFQLLEMNR